MPTEAEKLTVVIDTNVFVSGLNFPGRPREVLELPWQGSIDVYISPFIFEELERVLRDKFGWEESRLEQALQIIGGLATRARATPCGLKTCFDEGRRLDDWLFPRCWGWPEGSVMHRSRGLSGLKLKPAVIEDHKH